MQIIESTPFGVRSAAIRLACETEAPDVLLFPMVHVGEPEFYEDVATRLDACDLILCEGVRSPTVTLLTAAYRYFGQNPKLGLVLQNTMRLDHLEERIVHADVSSADFEQRWSRLPLQQRVVLPLVAPIFGMYLRFFGTRAGIGRRLGMNLQASRQELLEGDGFTEAMEIILDWRDRHLIQVLDEECERLGDGQQTVGVLFGARHMRAILVHLLRQRAYKVVKMDWMTVFSA